jgi:hypothetical protein
MEKISVNRGIAGNLVLPLKQNYNVRRQPSASAEIAFVWNNQSTVATGGYKDGKNGKRWFMVWSPDIGRMGWVRGDVVKASTKTGYTYEELQVNWKLAEAVRNNAKAAATLVKANEMLLGKRGTKEQRAKVLALQNSLATKVNAVNDELKNSAHVKAFTSTQSYKSWVNSAANDTVDALKLGANASTPTLRGIGTVQVPALVAIVAVAVLAVVVTAVVIKWLEPVRVNAALNAEEAEKLNNLLAGLPADQKKKVQTFVNKQKQDSYEDGKTDATKGSLQQTLTAAAGFGAVALVGMLLLKKKK